MSPSPRILIVEDNPTTLKSFRVVLESEGFRVVEAHDARTALEYATAELPDLVLQDLSLPDMSGFELVRQLRAVRGATDMPILAVSGFLGLVNDHRSADTGFSVILAKPVEPIRLIETVRAYLPNLQTRAEPGASKHRLLLVDDDPVQLKLARMHFVQLGFEVTTAMSGAEALRVAREVRPEVILTDVMMPETDGFELCLELHRDRALAGIPVVLLSAQYRTELDQSLARRVGANALVARTPEFAEAATAVLDALRNGPSSCAHEPSPGVQLEHAQVVIQELERQLAVSSDLAHRCTFQAAQLSLLTGVADALAKQVDPEGAMRDVLATTLDAAGISKGALLLKGKSGTPEVRHSIGFSEGEKEKLRSFFGHPELLDDALERREAFFVPSPSIPLQVATRILAELDTQSLHVVPLVSEGRGVGAIVLAARRNDITNDDVVAFARAMGNQMVQSLELASAFSRLAVSEARYRTLLECATDAIAVLTPAGVIGEVNRRWREILGKPEDQIIGRHLHEFAFYDQEHVEREINAPKPEPEKAAADLHPLRPVTVRTANGSDILMEFSNTPVELAGERLIFAVGRDVTLQVQAQEQVRVSDRMASVGSLAAAVAHEINNPLAAVTANLEFASQSVEALSDEITSSNLSEAREAIVDAREAATRVRSIVGDLRIFSRTEEDASGPVDVHRVLDSSLRIARNEIRHRAQVLMEYGDIPPALANEARLGQVFLNLLINAAQAVPEGHADANEIRVITRRDDVQERVVVEISDTGAGIPEDVLRRLFTPFFTTKAAGTGTGLGLAICQRIVAGFGGDIGVDSTVGKGTTFRVSLPWTLAESRRSRSSIPSPARAARRGKILIVDDEAMMGKIAARCFERDHDVSILTDAREALAQISAGGRFDVILCDLMMPFMTGSELHSALLSIAKDQAERMVFLTGGAFTPRTRAFLAEVPNTRLEKPFELDALRAIVNKRLG